MERIVVMKKLKVIINEVRKGATTTNKPKFYFGS